MERERLIELLQNPDPAKHYLKGKVLSKEEVNERFNSGRSIITHTAFIFEPHEVLFFSDNHLFGFGVLSDEYVPCSMSGTFEVEPRDGLESGLITNVDEYIFIYGKNCTVLYSVEQLADYILKHG